MLIKLLHLLTSDLLFQLFSHIIYIFTLLHYLTIILLSLHIQAYRLYHLHICTTNSVLFAGILSSL